MLKSAKPRESGPGCWQPGNLDRTKRHGIASSGGRVPVLCCGLRTTRNGSDAAMNDTVSTRAENIPPAAGQQMVPALLVGILLGAAHCAAFAAGRFVALGPAVRRAPGAEHAGGRQPADRRQQDSTTAALETVVYTVDKVVSGEKENVILPDFLAGDRLLMLVHGEVVAGSTSVG